MKSSLLLVFDLRRHALTKKAKSRAHFFGFIEMFIGELHLYSKFLRSSSSSVLPINLAITILYEDFLPAAIGFARANIIQV